ncbi:MAG: hypothetical protein ACOYK8_00960 [Alphaproteobacteria bacterium]
MAMGKMGRELLLRGLEQGQVFTRWRNAGMEEKAKILKVSADPSGIPHVHFELDIFHGRFKMQDRRTLSLEVFSSLYKKAA